MARFSLKAMLIVTTLACAVLAAWTCGYACGSNDARDNLGMQNAQHLAAVSRE